MIVIKSKKVTLENDKELGAVTIALRHYVQNHALRPDEDEGKISIMRMILRAVEDIGMEDNDATHIEHLPPGIHDVEIVDTFARDEKLYCTVKYLGKGRGEHITWRIA